MDARFTTIGMATAAIIVGALGVVVLPRSPEPPPGVLGPSPSPTFIAPADHAGLPGWLVMERFGQAPDGSTTELDFDRRQIWLVRPDGTDLHELSPGEPAAGKVSPDVSPDGTTIAFSTFPGSELAWEVDVAGGEPRLLSIGCSGFDTECMEWDPAYSPDDSRVAVGRLEVIDGEPWTLLAIRDRGTGERTDLVATRRPMDEGWPSQPTWSPDGTHLAYHWTPNVAEGYPTGLTGWLVDVVGGEPQRLLTPDGEDAADLDWSPDGSRIVYSTTGAREFEGQTTPPARIVSIRPDGSDPIVLCDDTDPSDLGCWAPTWMPDGRHVLYYGFRTYNLVAADGTGAAPINRSGLTWFGSLSGQGYGYLSTWLPER